jgi:hypothetical protein
MPKFVIERQYLVPMYQHVVVEADNLEAACKEGISLKPAIAEAVEKARAKRADCAERTADWVPRRGRASSRRILHPTAGRCRPTIAPLQPLPTARRVHQIYPGFARRVVIRVSGSPLDPS